MKLQLKSIKHSKFASHETHCFEAVIYVSKKPFALVSNQGCGGTNSVYPHKNFYGDYQKTLKEVEHYLKSLPKIKCEFFPDGREQDLEAWCGTEVDNFLNIKDMKKNLKTKILFLDEGKIFQFSIKKYGRQKIIDHIETNYPNAIILNTLSQEKAFSIWMKNL